MPLIRTIIHGQPATDISACHWYYGDTANLWSCGDQRGWCWSNIVNLQPSISFTQQFTWSDPVTITNKAAEEVCQVLGRSFSINNKQACLSQWPPNWIFQGSNFYSLLVCLLNLNKIDIITTKLCFPIVLKIIIPGSQDCNLIKILLMTKLGHFQKLHKWHLTSKATAYLNQQFHKVSLVSVTKFLWYLKKSPLYSCHCNPIRKSLVDRQLVLN